jgi:hypothetical protein
MATKTVYVVEEVGATSDIDYYCKVKICELKTYPGTRALSAYFMREEDSVEEWWGQWFTDITDAYEECQERFRKFDDKVKGKLKLSIQLVGEEE